MVHQKSSTSRAKSIQIFTSRFWNGTVAQRESCPPGEHTQYMLERNNAIYGRWIRILKYIVIPSLVYCFTKIQHSEVTRVLQHVRSVNYRMVMSRTVATLMCIVNSAFPLGTKLVAIYVFYAFLKRRKQPISKIVFQDVISSLSC